MSYQHAKKTIILPNLLHKGKAALRHRTYGHLQAARRLRKKPSSRRAIALLFGYRRKMATRPFAGPKY